GSFDALGLFTRDNGISKTNPLVDFSGDAVGFRAGFHWPTLRYRDWNIEASLGLIATVGWLHEETSSIPGGVLLTADAIDVLTGSFGPKANFRALMLGNAELELQAEYSFPTGGVRGWTKECSAGIGIHF